MSAPRGPWYVVVERSELYEPYAPLPDYAVGPYATRAQADAALESDSGTVYCLLTVDAKRERYCAGGDVYVADHVPEGGVVVTPYTWVDISDGTEYQA